MNIHAPLYGATSDLNLYIWSAIRPSPIIPHRDNRVSARVSCVFARNAKIWLPAAYIIIRVSPPLSHGVRVVYNIQKRLERVDIEFTARKLVLELAFREERIITKMSYDFINNERLINNLNVNFFAAEIQDA